MEYLKLHMQNALSERIFDSLSHYYVFLLPSLYPKFAIPQTHSLAINERCGIRPCKPLLYARVWRRKSLEMLIKQWHALT